MGGGVGNVLEQVTNCKFNIFTYKYAVNNIFLLLLEFYGLI